MGRQIAPGGDQRDSLTRAINEASDLRWRDDDTWAYIAQARYQDLDDATTVWLPALSIPVRRKTHFTMPSWHREAMAEDLRKVSTVVAVGWRARERHFLQLLQDELPSRPSRLVVVAENDGAAHESADQLWETGRFDRYAISGIGFSGFTATPTELFTPNLGSNHTPLALRHVLTSNDNMGIWTRRQPGPGLSLEPNDSPFVAPDYTADL